MATAPLRSGFAEINSSRRVLGSAPSYRVGPWPAIMGWTSNLYSSIRSRRSSSVASLPLPRSTPAGVASLSVCTPVRRSPAMWWLLVHGKSFRVDDTTDFGLASSLPAHSRGSYLDEYLEDPTDEAARELFGLEKPAMRLGQH